MKITLSLSEFNRMKKTLSKKANGKKTGIDMAELKKIGVTTSVGFNSVSLVIDDNLACTVLEMLTEKESGELKEMVTKTMKDNSFLGTVMNILISARLRILKRIPAKG
jgi:hypothetical protein